LLCPLRAPGRRVAVPGGHTELGPSVHGAVKALQDVGVPLVGYPHHDLIFKRSSVVSTSHYSTQANKFRPREVAEAGPVGGGQADRGTPSKRQPPGSSLGE